MANTDLNLKQYNISTFGYRQLKYFCLRYPEMKRQIADLHNPLHAMNYDGMPHGTGPGEPTAAAAERSAQLSMDCELIEQTAIEADSQIYQYILLAATRGISYRDLRECSINGLAPLPAGQDMFNARRHLFFYLLAKKKGIV